MRVLSLVRNYLAVVLHVSTLQKQHVLLSLAPQVLLMPMLVVLSHLPLAFLLPMPLGQFAVAVFLCLTLLPHVWWH